MKHRERNLLTGFIGFVLLFMLRGWLWSLFVEPFETRAAELTRLTKSVSNNTDQLTMLARSLKTVKEAKQASLPLDPGNTKRPDALNAQRLYLQWMTDLAQLCGFEDSKVLAPRQPMLKDNVYVSVSVKLEAEAHYAQIARFLDLFYRTELLHRVTLLHISTNVFEGDPLLKVSLEAEGLALIGTPSRRTLFPQTTLLEGLVEDGTTIQVAIAEGFPKTNNFRIQLKTEYLTVTAMDGSKWTVERGVERTEPAAYPAETVVELVRLNSNQQDRSAEEFRELVAANIFLKPVPAVQYKPKLAPIGDKTFMRGKPVEFTLGVLGYDASRGKPLFELVGTPPAGLILDKFGKISWKPANDVKADKYPIQIEIQHPSIPNGILKETVTITLREPNAPAKLANPKPVTVYLNREWKYRPELSDPDSPNAKYSWKLGDKPPEGVSIQNKTGEITWIPGDTVPLGEITIPIIVTDDSVPPQSSTLALKLNIQDDAAQFTKLIGTFNVGSNKRAFLYDPSQDKKTELHEGDKFAVAELNGIVKIIEGKFVIVTLNEHEVRLDVGQSLREALAKSKEYE